MDIVRCCEIPRLLLQPDNEMCGYLRLGNRPGGRIRGHLVHGLGGIYRPADVNTPHTAHRGSSGRQSLMIDHIY